MLEIEFRAAHLTKNSKFAKLWNSETHHVGLEAISEQPSQLQNPFARVPVLRPRQKKI
jgi:hypothetical protein